MDAFEQHDESGNPVMMAVQDVNGSSGFAPLAWTIEHARRHSSQMFFATGYVTGIVASGTIDFAIQVGPKDLHLSRMHNFGGDILVELHSGAAWSAGTPLGVHNHRLFNDGKALPSSSIVQAPTVSNAGTIIRQLRYPGGTTGNSVGSAAFEDELIFPANTLSYFYRITNLASVTSWVNILFNFYEYTPL